MFYLNLDAETGRVLSANTTGQGVAVESLPEGNISEYLYIDGAYVHHTPTETEPSPELPPEVPTSSTADELLSVLLKGE